MINLIMLVVLAACAAGMYLKGTLVHAAFMVFNAILAGFAALAFYELLATYLIKYVPGLAVWAPLIGFVLLFIVVFALLQTAVLQLSKEKTDMGLWPERIGRAVCGLVLGYVIFGNLLLAAAMAPIPSAYPYPRFADRNPNPSQPTKPVFSPDGFVSGLFSMVSQGSFSALGQPRSFAMMHAGFVDSLYLNRQKPANDVPIATKEVAIEAPRKGDVWEAPATLRGDDGQPPSVPADRKLMIVRVRIRKVALSDAGKFTLSQWRLLCSPRGLPDPLAGKGQSVCPIGFVQGNGTLARKPLDEIITIVAKDVPGSTKDFDLAFAVPSEMVPTLIAFKQNNIAQLPSGVSTDGAPAETSSGEGKTAPAQSAPRTEPNAQTPPAAPAPQQDRRGASGNPNRGGLSPAGQAVIGGALDPDINPQ
jgi:uncharacterized membrane protein required for colicin V production